MLEQGDQGLRAGLSCRCGEHASSNRVAGQATGQALIRRVAEAACWCCIAGGSSRANQSAFTARGRTWRLLWAAW